MFVHIVLLSNYTFPKRTTTVAGKAFRKTCPEMWRRWCFTSCPIGKFSSILGDPCHLKRKVKVNCWVAVVGRFSQTRTMCLITSPFYLGCHFMGFFFRRIEHSGHLKSMFRRCFSEAKIYSLIWMTITNPTHQRNFFEFDGSGSMILYRRWHPFFLRRSNWFEREKYITEIRILVSTLLSLCEYYYTT